MNDAKFIPLEERLPMLAGGGWHGLLRGVMENVLGLHAVRMCANRARDLVERLGANGFEALLAAMEFGLDADGVVQAIPPEGPLVIIANHPFGGPEAVALPALAIRARPDVKVLGNNEVMALADMKRWMLPLEILGGEGGARQNLRMLKLALGHLRGGGALVVFPAGGVAHWQWDSARVEDPPWPGHTARMIGNSGASVLPVRFHGNNGPLFELLGAVHPLLRSALLPRAFLAMRGQAVRCRAGKVLRSSELPPDAERMTSCLRSAVEAVSADTGN